METSDEAGADVTGHAWRLEGCRRTEAPIKLVGTGGGPIWLRLRTAERALLAEAGAQTTGSHTSRAETDDDDRAPAETSSPPSDERTAAPSSAEEARAPSPPSEPVDVAAEVRESAIDISTDRAADTDEEPAAVAEASPASSEGDPAESADGSPAKAIERARWRAMAYVPATMVSVDEASRILIRLRDDEIKPSFPGVQPEHGILRRTMLNAFLDEGVASLEDYEELIPADSRRATDSRHAAAYLQPILAILAKVK